MRPSSAPHCGSAGRASVCARVQDAIEAPQFLNPVLYRGMDGHQKHPIPIARRSDRRRPCTKRQHPHSIASGATAHQRQKQAKAAGHGPVAK